MNPPNYNLPCKIAKFHIWFANQDKNRPDIVIWTCAECGAYVEEIRP